jgi:DNA segregation ATPase FtsK/SpoIIIE, S-DNA-T family
MSDQNSAVDLRAYIRAIGVTGDQFEQWERKQEDLKSYQKQYDAADALLKSIGYKLPDIEVLNQKTLENLQLPTLVETRKILERGELLVASRNSSHETLLQSKSALDSSLEKLESSLKSIVSQLEDAQNAVLKDENALDVATHYKRDELQKLQDDFDFRTTFGNVGSIFLILGAVIGFISWGWGGLILSVIAIGSLFGALSDLYDTSTVSKKIDSISQSRQFQINLARKAIDNGVNRRESLKREKRSVENQIKQARDNLYKNAESIDAMLSQSEKEIFNHLKCFARHILVARHSAQKVAILEFNSLFYTQKISLEKLFDQWNAAAEDSDQPPRMLAKTWQDQAWESEYQPQTAGQAPECLRIGQLLLNNIDSTTNKVAVPTEIPAMMGIRAVSMPTGTRFPGHIVVLSDAGTRIDAVQALEALALRLLSSFPVRKLKASLIDPVAMGDTFPFKNLPKSMLSGQQIFTQAQDIQEELKTLVNHIEQVIQNYLGRNYATLEDYNAASQSIEEAYRYLCIADFPTAFDQRSADQLKSIITNGSRAGVYTIIHVDLSIDLSKGPLRGFDYSLFDRYCTVIRPANRRHKFKPIFETQFPDLDRTQFITLDQPPDPSSYQHIIQSIIAAEKTIKVETVPFTNLYPTALWQATSQQELRAPIGLTGARDRIEFWLGENDEKITVSSGLLAGKPGAGKSYTLHSIILSLAMQYSPAELELYLLDYKEGVEFQIYVDPNRADTINPTAELDETRALPHAKVISIESDREFGLSVLQAIQQEIETRGQLFKNVGVSELKDYRQKTGEQLPRVLVVIDEFQYMFQDNDAISRDLNQLYEDITRRGRSFGVHLLLASQSLNIANIKSSIYNFIPLRMAMQMDQSTAGIVLAEGNTDAISQLDRSGRIIYNIDFGRKQHNTIGQIADVSLEERRNAMNQIYQQSETSHYQRPQPLTLFQGNRPSKISQNGQLLRLAKLDNWLTSSALNKQIIHSQDWITQEHPAALWLGEAMRIGHHTHAILRRRARSNMLLIGQSEQSIFGILSGALLSLVHIYQPTKAEFHIIDLSQTDDDEALAEMTNTFRQSFQDLYPIKLGKRFPDSAQSIKRSEAILTELHEELQRRKQIRDADPDAMDFGPSVFFVAAIGALNRAQNLRPVAGKRSDEMSPDAQKLQEIVTIGPELGIHTILWFDNAKTFQQLCAESSPRNLLMQFDCRAVLHLPGEDSRLFLGEPIAEKLPALRAYYYDAGLSVGFEKFKPYAIPSASEIQQYANNLKQRQP